MKNSLKYLIWAALATAAAATSGCLGFFVTSLYRLMAVFAALLPVALGLWITFILSVAWEKRAAGVAAPAPAPKIRQNQQPVPAKKPFIPIAVCAAVFALFFGILGFCYSVQTASMYKSLLGTLILVFGVAGSLAALVLDGVAALVYYFVLKKSEKRAKKF